MIAKLLLILLVYVSLAQSKLKTNLKDWIDITPKSIGQPWPLPQSVVQRNDVRMLDSRVFSFQFTNNSQVCDLVTDAFSRYFKIIFQPTEYEIIPGRRVVKKARKFRQQKFKRPTASYEDSLLKRLVISIKNPCEDYPTLDSDESYTLQVTGDTASLISNSCWGTLRGLETFSQLVYENDDGAFQVNDTLINDFPRFKHRGLLLDTSRHFLSKEILMVNLEAMAANKMNVFHWHIVDDQSFPYQSITFPTLSSSGAYDPYNHVYTQEDIKEIIEFARVRGIRVIPEFDSPGHTLSWGNALPILTPCYSDSQPDGTYGPIDPTNNATYTFLDIFFKEITSVFPDKYVHLGGDEVDFDCWRSNPAINEFMQKMGFGNDYSKLEQYYEQNLLDIIASSSPKSGYIIWQEVVDNNVIVKPDTVVEVWKNPYPDELAKVTQLGYPTILSSCWYLDYISYGADWVNYYSCDPYNFNGTIEQKEKIVGGEACLWGELVDGTNVIARAWPRASAVAERLWSAQSVNNSKLALPRLEEHRCRMIRRGLGAQPMQGPGYCDYEIQV